MADPTPYITDEYIYQLASMDFLSLVPRSNIWGYGEDGTIAAVDPWLLRSASNDFGAMGLAPGMLVHFTGPKSVYGTAGEFYAVDVAGVPTVHHVRVRRVGGRPGAGEPPGLTIDMTGIIFDVPTLRPQVDQAGGEVDAAMSVGVGPIPARSDLPATAAAQLQRLCAFIVLRDMYLSMAQSMNEIGGGKSTFYAKSREYGDRVTAQSATIRALFASASQFVSTRRGAFLYRV